MSTKLPPEEIPEVQAFLEVHERLETFKKTNELFFSYLTALADEYNEKLADAERVVRQKDVTCGPFVRFQEQVRYDANALYEIVGREQFIALGGVETRDIVRSLNKERIDLNIANGTIPEDIAKQVKKVSGKFRKLSPVQIP